LHPFSPTQLKGFTKGTLFMSKPYERILSALRELEAEDLDLPEDEKYLDNALIIADDMRKFVANKTTFDPELIAVLLIQLQDQEMQNAKVSEATTISGYA
tara:strand:- start:523 stop:822 length:300 start_codon:yes stop_codon:yes gene_type:complete